MLKERLTEALQNKENDINSFTWKGKKTYTKTGVKQEERKLMDCSIEELNQYYKYCETMLYNKSKIKPGRYILLDIMKTQRNKCNAELFLRWVNREKGVSCYCLTDTLREFLKHHPQAEDENGQIVSTTTMPIHKIIGNCPQEFNSLTFEDVLSACLDSLGFFDKRHLTITFLLKQGVYLTNEEKKLKDKNMSNIEYIKECLDLHPNAEVYYDTRGLSLEQMKSMITLKSKKYSEMTTMQLELLRNRILFALENDIQHHIQQWEKRQKQIKMVLEAKQNSK